MRAPRLLLLVPLLALALAACGDDDEDDDAAGDTTTTEAPADDGAAAVTGSIDAEAEQSGDGTTLTVDSVTIDGAAGWVSVHADLDGGPGPIVGNASIDEGESSDVTVTFDDPVESGTYWPMLHVDEGEVGTYEFPDGPDVPVTDGEDVVMVQVELTVE